MLVVGDRNGGDIAPDLWRDCKLARCDKRVIRGFEMRGIVPVDVSRRPSGAGGGLARAGHEGMPAEEVLARLLWRLFLLRGCLFLFRGRAIAGFALFLGRLRGDAESSFSSGSEGRSGVRRLDRTFVPQAASRPAERARRLCPAWGLRSLPNAAARPCSNHLRARARPCTFFGRCPESCAPWLELPEMYPP